MLFLYKMTNDQRYLDFAAYIIQEGGAKGGSVYQAAIQNAVNPYQYSTTKAYELTSFFEGVIEYYLITMGDTQQPVDPSTVDLTKPVTLSLKSDFLACTVNDAGYLFRDMVASELTDVSAYAFQFEAGGYGYMIQHLATGKYVSTAEGTNEIILRDKDEVADQWWSLVEDGDSYKLKTSFYDYLISDKENGIFHLYPDAGVDAQRFVLANVVN